MQKRSPISVFLLGFITLGIYSWYWAVKTKGELNKQQTAVHIPTAWIWLIPIVGAIWWLWKYSEAVEKLTNGKVTAILTFLLLWLLGGIGQAIIQNTFNETAAAPATTSAAAAAPTIPTEAASPVATPAASPPAEESTPPPTDTPQPTPPSPGVSG